jgi:hypothetical protein
MSNEAGKMPTPRDRAVTRKHSRRRRRWRCIFGRPGQPTAFIEEFGDGWHVIVAGRDVGTTASEEAAVQLAEKINGSQR